MQRLFLLKETLVVTQFSSLPPGLRPARLDPNGLSSGLQARLQLHSDQYNTRGHLYGAGTKLKVSKLLEATFFQEGASPIEAGVLQAKPTPTINETSSSLLSRDRLQNPVPLFQVQTGCLTWWMNCCFCPSHACRLPSKSLVLAGSTPCPTAAPARRNHW